MVDSHFLWDSKWLKERYMLAKDRVENISKEETVHPLFRPFFYKGAKVVKVALTRNTARTSLPALENLAIQEGYHKSYLNPTFAVTTLGQEYGPLLSALLAGVLRGSLFSAPDNYMIKICLGECFIQVYNLFEERPFPDAKQIKEVLYWFYYDYIEMFLREQIQMALVVGEALEESDGEPSKENRRKIEDLLLTEKNKIRFPGNLLRWGWRLEEAQWGLWPFIKEVSKELKIQSIFLPQGGCWPVPFYSSCLPLQEWGRRQWLVDHRQDGALFLDGRFLQRYEEALEGIIQDAGEELSSYTKTFLIKSNKHRVECSKDCIFYHERKEPLLTHLEQIQRQCLGNLSLEKVIVDFSSQ